MEKRIKIPDLKGCFVAKNATILGDVLLGKDASVWYNAVIRGDEAPIRIGANTNIQDNCTLHCSPDHPLIIGEGVTVGHNAVLHGCTIGNNVLIGMGAIVLNGATIGDDCVIGAGSLVTENQRLEPGTLAYGLPAKAVAKATDAQIESTRHNAILYVEFARDHFVFPVSSTPKKL